MSGVLTISPDNNSSKTDPVESSNLPTDQAPNLRELVANVTDYDGLDYLFGGGVGAHVATPLATPPDPLLSPSQRANMYNGMQQALDNTSASVPDVTVTEVPAPVKATFVDRLRYRYAELASRAKSGR